MSKPAVCKWKAESKLIQLRLPKIVKPSHDEFGNTFKSGMTLGMQDTEKDTSNSDGEQKDKEKVQIQPTQIEIRNKHNKLR